MSTKERRTPVPSAVISNAPDGSPAPHTDVVTQTTAQNADIGGRSELRGSRKTLLTAVKVIAVSCAAYNALRACGNYFTAAAENPLPTTNSVPAAFAEKTNLLFGSAAEKMQILQYLDDNVTGDCAVTPAEEFGDMRPLWTVYQDFTHGNGLALQSYIDNSSFSEETKASIKATIQKDLGKRVHEMTSAIQNEPQQERHPYMQVDAFIEAVSDGLARDPKTNGMINRLKDALYQEVDNMVAFPWYMNIFPGYALPSEFLVRPQGNECIDKYNETHRLSMRRTPRVDMTQWRAEHPVADIGSVVGNRKTRRVVSKI
jgi:hypothetical protein